MTGTIPRTALVTGASSGIGEATARRLRSAGFVTYGAARRTDRLQALAIHGVRTVPLDVTDDDSARACFDRIIDEAGHLDVLVNNAGYGSFGAVEDVSFEDAHRQFEVNIFGAMRMARLALPHMRKRRSGAIVNVSSVGGRMAAPLGGWYHASKFAIEALSDSLRMEVAPYGIRVVVIEPGQIATEFNVETRRSLVKSSGEGPYANLTRAAISALLDNPASLQRASPPSVVADAIHRSVLAGRPRTRYPVGNMASSLLWARAILPDRWFDAMVMRLYGSSAATT